MEYKKIWVLGSSNIDTTYRMQEIPKKGYTVTAKTCEVSTGGKGANQAFAAAHWGAEVEFIGAVGNDEDGKTLIDALKAKDVGTNYVYTSESQSGRAIIYVDNTGSNCIVVYPGANQTVPIYESIEFKKNELLISQLEINMDAISHYFSVAKKTEMITVLNASPYQSIPQEIIRNTDIIVVNENEAFELGRIQIIDEDSGFACAKEIMQLGPKAVVITLGGEGAIYYSDEEKGVSSGYKVKVVDTQGAGDAFLGSFAFYIACNHNIEKAVEFANAVGALAVSKKGTTQQSMPSRLQINDLLRKA